MKIVRSAEEIQALWTAANEATGDGDDDYAEGVYSTLQWLTGNGERPDLEDI